MQRNLTKISTLLAFSFLLLANLSAQVKRERPFANPVKFYDYVKFNSEHEFTLLRVSGDSVFFTIDGTEYWINGGGGGTGGAETDPIFSAHLASSITPEDTARWGQGGSGYTDTTDYIVNLASIDITAGTNSVDFINPYPDTNYILSVNPRTADGTVNFWRIDEKRTNGFDISVNYPGRLDYMAAKIKLPTDTILHAHTANSLLGDIDTTQVQGLDPYVRQRAVEAGSFDGQFSSLAGIPAGLSDGDDDTNTQLSEAEVDAMVADNGYMAGLADDDNPQLNGNLDIQNYTIEGADDDDFVKLSQITASAGEINYVNSVTSNIQLQLNNKVTRSGNEDINGVKAFAEYPLVYGITPTNDYQLAPKGYVDNAVSGGASEIDPIFSAHLASSITTVDTTRWGLSATGASSSGTENKVQLADDNGGFKSYGSFYYNPSTGRLSVSTGLKGETGNLQFETSGTAMSMGMSEVEVHKKMLLLSTLKYNVISRTLTDNTPSDAQIDSATQTTPSAAGAGTTYIISDADGSGLLYIIISDGTNWFYSVMNKAL